MDIRQRRLISDFNAIISLNDGDSLIHVEPIGNQYDRYIVTYRCKGLQWIPERPRPSITRLHKLEVYLHLDYPRLPPKLQWLTEIFHPNILSPDMNGGVCVGKWAPSESLSMLVVRVGEMVQYKNYSTSDALNLQAADWAAQHESAFPVDNSPLVGEKKLEILLNV